ncbi:MAG: hypothetical protein HYU37_20255 [Acidobacteria bacterium]|nr:hypothetical protein [Acidobacteriota bacterium]
MRPWGAALALGVVVSLAWRVAATPWPDPFAFLASGTPIGTAERGRLQAGAAIVTLLPATSRELGVAAAVRIDAPPERLIAWMTHIEALRRSRYVPVIARLSNPPRLDDLAALALDRDELDDLRRCRPGDCAIKLSAAEMVRLQQHVRGAPGRDDDVQQEFRRIVLDRVEAYLQGGDAALPPYNDKRLPVSPASAFALLVERLGLARPPGLAEYLQAFPRTVRPDVIDSFLYWSKETFGAKPIVNVTHVVLLQSDDPGAPPALAVSKQVFATHYRDAAVSLTAVTARGPDRYLLYVHRSHIDVLQGFFGGLARRVIEGRIRDEAAAVLDAVRRRLEEGDPP